MAKVMIVIEDTGGPNFTLRLDGIAPDRKNTPDDEQTAAEFWGRRLFQIVVGIVNGTGAINEIKDRRSSS